MDLATTFGLRRTSLRGLRGRGVVHLTGKVVPCGTVVCPDTGAAEPVIVRVDAGPKYVERRADIFHGPETEAEMVDVVVFDTWASYVVAPRFDVRSESGTVSVGVGGPPSLSVELPLARAEDAVALEADAPEPLRSALAGRGLERGELALRCSRVRGDELVQIRATVEPVPGAPGQYRAVGDVLLRSLEGGADSFEAEARYVRIGVLVMLGLVTFAVVVSVL